MTRRDMLRIKSLQNKCTRAARLHADLAEAIFELLFHSAHREPSRQDRLKLARWQRQEVAAISAYLQAKTDLITNLSVRAYPADKGKCPVPNAIT